MQNSRLLIQFSVKSGSSLENITVVCESVSQRLSNSICHRSQQLSISRSSVQRILSVDASKIQLTTSEANKSWQRCHYPVGYWCVNKLIVIFRRKSFSIMRQLNCRIWGSEHSRDSSATQASTPNDNVMWVLDWRSHYPLFLRKWSQQCSILSMNFVISTS